MTNNYYKLQQCKRFSDFENSVTDKLRWNFNQISLQAVNKLYDDALYEYIDLPEFKECETEEEREDEQSSHYPMWGTLWEDANNILKDYTADELNDIVGVGRIHGNDYTDDLMFVAGAGYSFYMHHWAPLFVELLQWIDLNDYFTKTELKKAGFENK